MKLSLSVRIAETFHSKRESSMTINELIDTATSIGYSALCMRASQAGVDTSPEKLVSMASGIAEAGLGVSMITGDYDVPQNDVNGPNGLRNITPYLDLADHFGANLIRVCMKSGDDIFHARRASDEAAERGIRLAHQSHFASLFETVAGSQEALRAVGRDNFGLIYEPANWLISGQDYVGAISELRPWIFNVYIQNHRVHPEGTDHLETWTKGRVALDHIGIWEIGGVDGDAVFDALHATGYDGYVTVHQAFEGVMEPTEAARKSFEFLAARATRQ